MDIYDRILEAIGGMELKSKGKGEQNERWKQYWPWRWPMSTMLADWIRKCTKKLPKSNRK